MLLAPRTGFCVRSYLFICVLERLYRSSLINVASAPVSNKAWDLTPFTAQGIASMHYLQKNVRQSNLQLVFFCRLFYEEMSEFYSRACFVIFKLNFLPKLKKLKDLKTGQDITK